VSFLRQGVALLSRWIDDVCLAILSLGDLTRPRTKFQVVEQDDQSFLVQALKRRSAIRVLGAPLRFVEGDFREDAGGRVRSRLEGGQIEIVLSRRRFVFRSLELPQQAAGFLDAIVRAQIDRLTPWNPSQAAFGCSAPTEIAHGRVGIVVAATALASVMPFVTALEALKPNAVVVSAAPDAPGVEGQSRTVVFSQRTNRERSMGRVRRFVLAAPAATGFAALAAIAVWMFVGLDMESSRLQISRQIAERRVALLSGRTSVSDEATAKLAQKKREAAATVIVLEALSQALPDNTNLTELQVTESKLELSGVTHEAASLIRIIEQTDQFKNATFFAPTTRAPLENGEQFHIQAEIVPTVPVFP